MQQSSWEQTASSCTRVRFESHHHVAISALHRHPTDMYWGVASFASGLCVHTILGVQPNYIVRLCMYSPWRCGPTRPYRNGPWRGEHRRKCSGVARVEVLGLWGEADRGSKRPISLCIPPYQASPVALRSTDFRFSFVCMNLRKVLWTS